MKASVLQEDFTVQYHITMKSQCSTAEYEHPTVGSQATSVESQEETKQDEDFPVELEKDKGICQGSKTKSTNPKKESQDSNMVIVRGLDSLAKLLHQPCDSASLAATRILFGR